MPYTHTTFGQLQSALAARLGDAANRFWTGVEIPLYLIEALRTFGVLSGFWRERGTVPVVSGTAFYDLPSLFSLPAVIDFTVTDRDIIQQLQYALLENASSQTTWNGTEQFTYDDLVQAIVRRRNQFLADTGIVLTHSTQAVASPSIGRQALRDSVIDVRRASWVGASPFDYYRTLWREDERALVLANSDWASTSGTPICYSVMAPPPLQMQLAPAPVSSGRLDLVCVESGAALDPATSATALGIPDDLTPAIKWGALADLLGIDGQSRDPARAAFAEQRYQQFVALARMLPLVINAELGGGSIVPTTLNDLDAGSADWQNNSGVPAYLALAGWSMFALFPVPDAYGPYSVTLDVVRKAPVPASAGSYVQVGREQIDMILDYAEHLALFKVSGAEWLATQRQGDNFLLQAITYNQRLAASARYVIVPKEDSQRNKFAHPRRQQADGVGALPSVQEKQGFVAGNAPVRLKR